MPVIDDALAIRANHLQQMREQLDHMQKVLGKKASSDRVVNALAREAAFTQEVIRELLAIKKVFGRSRSNIHRRIASR